MTWQSARRERGFTLLEMLVALVVLGFVVAGLSQGLRFGLRATVRQERQSAERGDLDAVDRALRRLINQMEPGTSREPNLVLGEAAAVAFTTDLGDAARALATSQAEIRLSVENGRLVMAWRPFVHALRLAPAPPPQRTVLLDGLDRIEFSYWGQAGEGQAAWSSVWQQKALPALIRIRLVFQPGSTRRWPDIVAGPARPLPPGDS